MDRAVWQATVYGVAWSWTWLSDYIAAAGKAETKAEHSRTIVQQQSRVLVPPQRTLTIPLSFSAGTKASTQVEDDDFMLSTRFLELHPVTLPPTNQKKVCIEWRIMKTPSPNDSLLKNFYCWAGSSVLVFGHKSTFSPGCQGIEQISFLINICLLSIGFWVVSSQTWVP